MTSFHNLEDAGQLRRLAMMADNATLGLISYMQGKPRSDLLRQGIELCDILKSLPTTYGRRAILNIVRDTAITIPPTQERSKFICHDWNEVQDNIKAISPTLCSLIKNPEATNANRVFEDMKSRLGTLAMTFYQGDVANVRKLIEQKRFKVRE